ncbi:hypothetical protein B0J17DRAFT_627398 [Rhizoctonia solani]|nr:hypothetical protein B0J17DRAFT_627398 [Rhizoctonia solani]
MSWISSWLPGLPGELAAPRNSAKKLRYEAWLIFLLNKSSVRNERYTASTISIKHRLLGSPRAGPAIAIGDSASGAWSTAGGVACGEATAEALLGEGDTYEYKVISYAKGALKSGKIVDAKAVQCLLGRVLDRDRYWVIDQSTDFTSGVNCTFLRKIRVSELVTQGLNATGIFFRTFGRLIPAQSCGLLKIRSQELGTAVGGVSWRLRRIYQRSRRCGWQYHAKGGVVLEAVQGQTAILRLYYQ